MSVRILDRGNLTPQQVLAGTLNDPDFAQIDAVMVIYKTADGFFGMSCSNIAHSDKAAMAVLLLDYVARRLKDAS